MTVGTIVEVDLPKSPYHGCKGNVVERFDDDRYLVNVPGKGSALFLVKELIRQS